MDTISECRLTDFSRRWWCVYPLYGLILFALWRVLDRVWFMPMARPAWQEDLIVIIGHALIPGLYALVLRWPLRGASLTRVWSHLREKYPNECPWCRYDVRGCTTPVCPECGRPSDPEADTFGSS